MNENHQSPLVQPLELTFLSKILEDNSKFLHTKIAAEYLKDPFARTIYSIAGLSISKVGQFQPLIHLSDLCNDESRMEKYRNLQYPLDFTEATEIIHYIEKYKNDTISFETIEEELTKRWTRSRLTELANEILENVDNSKMHPSELMVKISGSLDSMIYQTHETVIAKTASEVSDEFLAYLYSDDVTTYTPSGIDAIDSVTGGTPKSCVISWVAPAKRLYGNLKVA